MKKELIKEIENDIVVLNNSDPSLDSNKDVIRKINEPLFKSVIIALSISLVLFFLSFFLMKTVTKLSIIHPVVFYVIVSIQLIYLIGLLVISILLKLDKIKVPAHMYFSCYKIYDLVGYIFKVLVILLFFVIFIITPSTVIGPSMETTLYTKDRVLVWHVGYTPKKNDIVVVDINSHYEVSESRYIKRIVATSNDKVEHIDGFLYVNGKVIERKGEKLMISNTEFDNMCKTLKDETDDVMVKDGIVPKGYSIVIGDNYDASLDSRRIGLIYNSDIMGEAIFRVLPLKGFGKI